LRTARNVMAKEEGREKAVAAMKKRLGK